MNAFNKLQNIFLPIDFIKEHKNLNKGLGTCGFAVASDEDFDCVRSQMQLSKQFQKLHSHHDF